MRSQEGLGFPGGMAVSAALAGKMPALPAFFAKEVFQDADR